MKRCKWSSDDNICKIMRWKKTDDPVLCRGYKAICEGNDEMYDVRDKVLKI